MTSYWRQKKDGVIVQDSQFMGGKGPSPEYRDRWEEVQVVVTSGEAVALPEVTEEAEVYSTGGGKHRTRKVTLEPERRVDLRAIEEFNLHNLAVVRYVIAQREAEQDPARIAERICQRGPRVPSLGQIEFVESLLRAGAIEEKGA